MLTILIIKNRASAKVGGGPMRSPAAHMLSELQLKAKLGPAHPSDEVERLKFKVKWESIKGMLGVAIDQIDSMAVVRKLSVVSVHELGVMKLDACPLGSEHFGF